MNIKARSTVNGIWSQSQQLTSHSHRGNKFRVVLLDSFLRSLQFVLCDFPRVWRRGGHERTRTEEATWTKGKKSSRESKHLRQSQWGTSSHDWTKWMTIYGTLNLVHRQWAKIWKHNLGQFLFKGILKTGGELRKLIIVTQLCCDVVGKSCQQFLKTRYSRELLEYNITKF